MRGGGTIGQERVFPPSYVAYMPIADAGIEMQVVVAKVFVQTGNKNSGLPSTDKPATIAPHPPVANSHQAAAKNDISFAERNTHALSFNGAPAPEVNP